MKIFKRGRSSSEFIKAAEAKGLKVSTHFYDQGGDHIAFEGHLAGCKVQGAFNTVNARVLGLVYRPTGRRKPEFHTAQRFNTCSTDFESEQWFQEVLNLANTDEERTQ